MSERDPMRMSWYELSGDFNVRFGAYRRTSDSYGECYTPAAARTPAIRLQPLSLSADASRRSSAMASAITAAMGAPLPLKQPVEPRVPLARSARPDPPAKPRHASVAMAKAKLPAFKLSVDDLTRSAAEAGLPFWTREKLQGLFQLFDTDRDNTIERAEFEYVAKQLMQARPIPNPIHGMSPNPIHGTSPNPIHGSSPNPIHGTSPNPHRSASSRPKRPGRRRPLGLG